MRVRTPPTGTVRGLGSVDSHTPNLRLPFLTSSANQKYFLGGFSELAMPVLVKLDGDELLPVGPHAATLRLSGLSVKRRFMRNARKPESALPPPAEPRSQPITSWSLMTTTCPVGLL